MKKFLSFLLPLLLILVSCEITGERTAGQRYEMTEYSPGFDRLPVPAKYKIKFRGESDSLIKVRIYVYDTLYFEDGTLNKLDYKQKDFPICLREDSMVFYFPYCKSAPELSFSTYEKVFDHRRNEFRDYFSFEFKYDKKQKYYYILKSDFPKMKNDGYYSGIKLGPWIQYDLYPGIIDTHLDLLTNNGRYYFTETHSSTVNESIIIEKNQESDFLRWFTGDTTFVNFLTK